MEIASIKGDEVLLLYHPADSTAEVGQQFAILELPDAPEEGMEAGPEAEGRQQNGLVVQVISNESLQYAGLQQENIQRIIEDRIADIDHPLDQESGMSELKNLKVATAKIRKRIRDGEWERWGGWIPSRNVSIQSIGGEELLSSIIPEPRVALNSFSRFEDTPIQFDGPRLDMVNVITGVKGTGKSHLAKLMVIALTNSDVPCIIFDLNGEYTVLPQAQVLEWGSNFIPDLAEIGYEILDTVIQAVYPLPDTSRSRLNLRLPQIFTQRRDYCEENDIDFSITLNYLRNQPWGGGQHVEEAIDRRLEIIEGMNLFMDDDADPEFHSLSNAYETACEENRPIVFDMREIPAGLRRALVKAMNRRLEDICADETESESERYPFVFFEEAHFYVSDYNILDIITRARHIGLASVFITNTPQDLPDSVFRQLDNLFLLGLSHRDDIRSVGKNSFTDEATIKSFATRMPKYHGLIMGKVTDRYPLVVHIDDLPEEVPGTGETRSTWDRFGTTEETQEAPPTPEDDLPFGRDDDPFEPDDDLPF